MARCLSLVAVLALTGVAQAEDAKEARAVVERAVKAMGGAKRLGMPALSGTGKGKVFILGKDQPVTNEWTVQGLDQVKWAMEVTLNDNPATQIQIVVNKDHGWIKGGTGEPSEIQKDALTPSRQGMLGLRLAESPLPLLGKEWKLTALGELKIGDQTGVGVKATRKDTPELDLWFDKATSLPIKAEMRLTEQGGEEKLYVGLFGGYKKVEGRMYFTKLKVLRDDKTVLDMERGDFKAKDKLDDATFAKP